MDEITFKAHNHPVKTSNRLKIQLEKDGPLYNYVVVIDDMPVGGGKISDTGLSAIKTAEQIVKLAGLEEYV